MLAWGNINVFDYRNCLLGGKISLTLWPVPKGLDALLNHLGTTGERRFFTKSSLVLTDSISGSNPNKDAPCLEVEFERYSTSMVSFPDSDEIEKYGRYVANLPPGKSSSLPELTKADLAHVESIQEIQSKDPLSELSEQEKDHLWQLRHVCCKKVPDALPKLLDAVKWNNRDEVSQVSNVLLFVYEKEANKQLIIQMFLLLQSWPAVSPETALELLDCKYADPFVRRLAVR